MKAARARHPAQNPRPAPVEPVVQVLAADSRLVERLEERARYLDVASHHFTREEHRGDAFLLRLAAGALRAYAGPGGDR